MEDRIEAALRKERSWKGKVPTWVMVPGSALGGQYHSGPGGKAQRAALVSLWTRIESGLGSQTTGGAQVRGADLSRYHVN